VLDPDPASAVDTTSKALAKTKALIRLDIPPHNERR
jgi:hypothetical protein